MRGSQLDLPAAEIFISQPGRFEEEGYRLGFRCVAGIDEVGRGPLAGPVVAAAVILPRGKAHPEIEDSKLIPQKKREKLATWIKENALAWGLGVVDVDRINILKASLLAMAHAYKELDPAPDYLLIDGQHQIPMEFFGRTFPQQRAIKKGDRLCVSIAAASIVAKVARDQVMMEYDRVYPEYGFGKHKGYGSPGHLAALSRYGPSPIHRRSFRPVRECLGADNSSQRCASQPGGGERKAGR